MRLSNRLSRRTVWLAGAGLCALVGLVTGLRWCNSAPFADANFERSIWLAHAKDDSADNPRGPMVQDLIKHLERAAPTHSAVVALLGPSEARCSELPHSPSSTATCLSYNLGMWSGFRIDYDSLDVYFDASGRFVAALQVQH